MVKLNLKYVNEFQSRNRLYYYYRRAGQKIRLPDNPLSQEFHRAYERTHRSFENGDALDTFIVPGSLRDLFVEFQKSSDYLDLKPQSRRDYKRALDSVAQKYGNFLVSKITPSFWSAWLDANSGKRRSANFTLSVIKRVLKWGVVRGFANTNSARDVKPLKHKAQPYPAWTAKQIDSLVNHKDVDKTVKLAVILGLYTGQRIGDVCGMTWEDYDGDTVQVVQEKTDARLVIPAHKVLRAALNAMDRGQGAILRTKTGAPMRRDYLRHRLGEACKTAGIAGRSFHGLRKSAAVALYEAGVDDAHIAAITGHKTAEMVRHYTRDAKQLTRARAAMDAWEAVEAAAKSD